jgi:hypothetical protein
MTAFIPTLTSWAAWATALVLPTPGGPQSIKVIGWGCSNRARIITLISLRVAMRFSLVKWGSIVMIRAYFGNVPGREAPRYYHREDVFVVSSEVRQLRYRRPLATRARGERAPAQGPESKSARCLPAHSAGSGWGAAQRREPMRLRGSPTHCGSSTPRGAAQRREAKRLRGSPTHCGSSTPRGAAQRREPMRLRDSPTHCGSSTPRGAAQRREAKR